MHGREVLLEALSSEQSKLRFHTGCISVTCHLVLAYLAVLSNSCKLQVFAFFLPPTFGELLMNVANVAEIYHCIF